MTISERALVLLNSTKQMTKPVIASNSRSPLGAVIDQNGSNEDMDGFIERIICRDSVIKSLREQICPRSLSHIVPISFDESRLDILRAAMSTWNFQVFDLTEDDLLLCTYIILDHAQMQEGLENYRISSKQLLRFVATLQISYHDNLYHNFRHAVDVLQTTYYLLVASNILHPFLGYEGRIPSYSNNLPLKFIDSDHILALCIAAVGHDIGHPGVTNAFLVRSKSSIAYLYNDRSVLESFHSSILSAIILESWDNLIRPESMALEIGASKVSHKTVRNLITETILSTDMALHFDFTIRIHNLGLNISENGLKYLPSREYAKAQTLYCCMLLKCADISNVSRPYDLASKWSDALFAEQSRQAGLQRYLSIAFPEHSLTASPGDDSLLHLSNSLNKQQKAQAQIAFVERFVNPLYLAARDHFLQCFNVLCHQLQDNMEKWRRTAGGSQIDPGSCPSSF